MWVGNNPSSISNNTLCYSDQNSPDLVAASTSFSLKFSCAASGRYAFIDLPKMSILIEFSELEIYSNTGSGCTPCASNSYSPGGQANLSIPCPQGLYSLPGSSDPSQCTCPDNAALSGVTCICSLGFLKSTNPSKLLGGWECISCPSNSMCLNGIAYGCPIGSYCPAGIPIQCPTNFFCPANSSSPQPCPTGSTSPAGAANCTCSDGYILSNNQCLQCQANTYCSGNIQSYCPPQSTSPAGSSSLASCSCQPGYYSSSGICLLCIPGSYCPGGSVMSNTVINVCPTGSFCPSGASSPISCSSTSGIGFTTYLFFKFTAFFSQLIFF